MGRVTEQTQAQIEQVLAGNPKAFKQLVDDYQRLVGQIVFRMIPYEAEREDLCQDVFLKVYENLGRFERKSKLSTWIARITYNTCLNYLEKKRAVLYDDYSPEGMTLDDCEGHHSTPSQFTESRQAAVRVCEEIDQLPVIQGTILSLYHLQEMTYAEIGDILSLPEGTVKSYLFRARKQLKERMQNRFRKEDLCA